MREEAFEGSELEHRALLASVVEACATRHDDCGFGTDVVRYGGGLGADSRSSSSALAAKMAEAPFKLLVVDSVMAHFRVDFTGRGELSERQQKLGQFCSKLQKIADEFNIAVVYTNQVQADPSGMSFAGMDPKKAIGGHVLAHASTIRLSVRKGRGDNRILKVVDAPNLKEADAEFTITDGGVVAADA